MDETKFTQIQIQVWFPLLLRCPDNSFLRIFQQGLTHGNAQDQRPQPYYSI